jgi:hypothetical protein
MGAGSTPNNIQSKSFISSMHFHNWKKSFPTTINDDTFLSLYIQSVLWFILLFNSPYWSALILFKRSPGYLSWNNTKIWLG